jgi:hypothetical protein
MELINAVAYPGIFSWFGEGGGVSQEFFSGVQKIQLRTEGRKNGDLNLPLSETRILVRLLWMYFPQNWEFGSTLSKLRNLRWGGLTPPPPFGTALINAR